MADRGKRTPRLKQLDITSSVKHEDFEMNQIIGVKWFIDNKAAWEVGGGKRESCVQSSPQHQEVIRTRLNTTTREMMAHFISILWRSFQV